ncbi:MAG: Asp-tRNA(Asn)/Glu-tRNA(Gln) amidotransferase subunit GatC [Coriobacteriales bacterium]|jgi:aspartyl-tRNA(Asn)/glutamyl-tRNA(Gln) amidotransferase subunit C|nr:Asp-tRNA(Asn)/Glu-tRNA(Gln) amidotransferase subunit GatC [Coriobacteriales bacterium]
MYLSENEVRDIATYTRIRLNKDAVREMTVYLNEVLDGLKPITQYQLEGVEPTFHPIAGLVNVMRDDVIHPGFSQAEALANAPDEQEGQFRITPILGGEGV